MPFKRSVMRFAHTNGHTDCCYSEDGENIITSGSDGDIRIWKGIDDDDPTSQCVGEFVLAISYYGQRMLASTDLNTVQGYTFPDASRDGTEFRFTAPVTTIKADKKYIAAGSEDTGIKCVVLDKSEEYFELLGHDGPILAIDTSPKELLASASGDGTIKIWDLKEKKELRTITGFEKVKSFYAAKSFVTPKFEPTRGNLLAYVHGKNVCLVDTTNWDVKTKLENGKVISEYTVCSFSHCGKYLAAGTVLGDISIWEVKTGEPVKGEVLTTDATSITAIEWNPLNNGELAYADNTGQLGTIMDCYDGDELENDIGHIDEDENDDRVNFDGIEFDDDNEDEDNENCVSLERLKKQTMHPNMDDEIDQLLEVQSNRTEAKDVDVNTFKGKPLQPPFQPTATPKHLEHRYLVWNSIGIVRAHNSNTENSIEAEFHDASIHHAIHMNNYLHHTMASLSSTVLALACETPSKLVCIALGAGSREWSISLPDCEEVLALAASDKLVAVATDCRNLRIFSAMGTQREVLSLPGPTVALAAHGDSILVAYHSADISDESNISVMLIRAIGLSLRCRDYIKLALTPGTKLQWIGFTDKGSPVSTDSAGMVRLYNLSGNYWMSICDTKLHIKNTSDNFFILDVFESSQIVRAILCRGSAFPVTTPKPMVHELPLQIPLCDLEAEKSLLEESLIRCVNLKVENAEKQMKEIALKLFALACRSEMEDRAKELIEIIASPHLLPLAIKYASKLGRIHLSEKLNELLPQLEEMEKEKEKESNDIEIEAINLLQNSPMNATLLLAQREKSNTPLIAPKPLFLNSQKRNPFKRGSQSLKPVKNPLSHLTDKAIGFNDSQTDLVSSYDNELSTADINGYAAKDSQETQCMEVENNENKAKNEITPATATSSTVPTFMTWFNENKDSLELEFPDAIAAELTKHSMRKYKQLFSKDQSAAIGSSTPTSTSHKRKMTEEDDQAKKSSGISKLAKFGFTK